MCILRNGTQAVPYPVILGDRRESKTGAAAPCKRAESKCLPIFSTLFVRVLKIYDLVTHSVFQTLIIQTVSKNKLISKNAY